MAVFPAGMLAVTFQSPGLLARSVCCQPEIGLHTSLLTVGSELVPWICGSAYGPQEPFAALVTQEAVGVEAGVEPVGDGLGEEDGVGELVGADAELVGVGEELDGAGEELDGAEVVLDGVADG